MQTDPSQSLEIQILDSTPMKQVDKKAKTPDASMLSIQRPKTQQKEPIQPTIPIHLLDKLHTNDTLQKLLPNLNEILESASPKETIESNSFIRTPELNSIQDKDPLIYFQTKNSNTGAMDIQTEEKKDPALRRVNFWIQNGCNDDIKYASFELKNYHKHLSRLQIQKSIVMRQFFDDIENVSFYPICISNHLRKEVLCRIHNLPTSGRLGIILTTQELRRSFYFPGLSEFLTDYIRNCL